MSDSSFIILHSSLKPMFRKLILPIFLLCNLFQLIACNGNAKQAPATQSGENTEQTGYQTDDQTAPKAKKKKGNRPNDNASVMPNASNGIPQKVYKVLEYVRANNDAMPGYVGGRNFQNRERQLEAKDASGQKIKYQEWDVNPKRNGVNRGTERLITGSDGRAWFTNNHYASFTEVK